MRSVTAHFEQPIFVRISFASFVILDGFHVFVRIKGDLFQEPIVLLTIVYCSCLILSIYEKLKILSSGTHPAISTAYDLKMVENRNRRIAVRHGSITPTRFKLFYPWSCGHFHI